MTFKYSVTAYVEEDAAYEAGEIGHLIFLDIGVIFADGEDGHDKSGGYEGKESDCTDEEGENNVELAEPEDLKEDEAEDDVFEGDHDVV